MTLLQRLAGEQQPNIRAHEFAAAIGEYKLGNISLAALQSELQGPLFGLDQDGRSGEMSAVASWFTAVVDPLTAAQAANFIARLERIMILAQNTESSVTSTYLANEMGL